ncbi:MAG: hypothetical protein M1827_006612 [Pycnora praestabilis]|nr:MAG: hypothetical protein M1827_006612 [Pycnora praestabilis]
MAESIETTSFPEDGEVNTRIPSNTTINFEPMDQFVADEEHREWKAGRQEYLIMLSLSIVSLMVAIDASILVPALPVIAKDLGGSASEAFWAGTSYLLTNAVFQPFMVSLSDIFGRRELLTSSIILFTVGSIVCCAAQNFTQLLVGRSVQGVGGGGIISMGIVVMTDIVPLRQRPKYSNFIQMAWAIGTVAGPLLGGSIAEHTTWRWIFYINFPICAVGLVMVPLVVKLKTKRSSLAAKILRVDWFGGFLFIASTTSFLMGITWGGVQFSWGSFQTWLPLLLGVLGIFGTVAWEIWGARQPLLRMSVFRSSSAVPAYICATIQGLIVRKYSSIPRSPCILLTVTPQLLAQTYYIPFYLETVKSLSPTIAGVSLMALQLTFLPASVITAVMMTKKGSYRWAVWSGSGLIVFSTGLLIVLDVNTSTVSWVFIFIVTGVSQGLLLSSLNFAIQAISTIQDVAYAAAMYAFLRTFGMCLGVAIGGTVFQNELAKRLADAGLPVEIAKNAESFAATLDTIPANSQYHKALVKAFAQTFRVVFGVLTGISVMGGLASLGIGEHSMDKALDSEHMLRREKTNDQSS